MIKEDKYFITDKSDVVFYFEIIRQLKARKVLDIGLTLQRVGAIAEQVGILGIDDGVSVSGFKGDDMTHLPIYETIYDRIYSENEVISEDFDLAILIKPIPEWKDWLQNSMWQALLHNTRVLATDVMGYEIVRDSGVKCYKVQDANVDGDVYKIVYFR